MTRPRSFVPIITSVVLAASAAACGGPGSTANPGPTATSGPSAPAEAFTLEVQPAQSTGRTIGGAKAIFLVTVSGTPSDGPVQITASAPGATVAIEPNPLTPGVVGEVTIVPAPVTADEVLVDVSIAGTRGEVVRTQDRTLTVVPGQDDWAADAAAHLAPFISWLETNRPDLGITAQTEWAGTPGSWVLIVNHYLYFSAEWELDIEWHVMIPPDDWSRIYLRKRFSEVAPSVAFEISSVSGATAPHEIEPPDAMWR